MSVQAITWALSYAVKSPAEKAVLLVLANYADGDGVCWPGQDNIAAQAACSDRTVRAVLTAFEDRGVIARQHRQRRDGSRTSDEIRLVAFAESNRQDLPQGQPEKASARPTGNLCRSNRKSVPIQPEAASGPTTFEPSGEPSEEPSPLSSAEPSARRTSAKPDVDAVWSIAPRQARERSSRKDVETALHAAKRRGHALGDIIAGLRAAYASRSYQGDTAKGVHRLIQNDRWASFIEAEEPAAAWDDARWRSALGLYADEGWWPDTMGPKPGEPGCRVPSHLTMPANDANAPERAA